jgi:hypothetical protein
MARRAIKYKIKRSVIPMFIIDYCDSGLYLGKKITRQRVSQLIRRNILRICRVNPKMIYSDEITEKK